MNTLERSTMSCSLSYADRRQTLTAILRPSGLLDGSNYEGLIAQAHPARAAGAAHLVVDLSDVTHVGTAGLVALYIVAHLAQGSPPPNPASGWVAIRALADDRPEQRLAVVSPGPPVDQTLARAPFSAFLILHRNLTMALAALPARAH